MPAYIIQTILLPTRVYSVDTAMDWISSHGFVCNKIDTTDRYHRFRQHTTQYAKNRGCNRMRTIPIGHNGVKFVVAYCSSS